MFFKRQVQRYGESPEAVTPYSRAGQVWDRRIGSAVAQASNWRALAFGAVAVSLVLASGMVWIAGQNRVTPYVVEVNALGDVKAVAPAATPYNPTDAQISWFLARFITNIRSLSIDPVLVRQNWLEAYDFATDRAALFLNAQAQAEDPFKGVGERSVTVVVTSVVRASPTSFQVKWVEQAYQGGVLTGSTRWTAILSIQQKPPHREDVLRRNPLGLYVTQLAWSPDYAAPSVAQPAASTAISAAETSE